MVQCLESVTKTAFTSFLRRINSIYFCIMQIITVLVYTEQICIMTTTQHNNAHHKIAFDECWILLISHLSEVDSRFDLGDFDRLGGRGGLLILSRSEQPRRSWGLLDKVNLSPFPLPQEMVLWCIHAPHPK